MIFTSSDEEKTAFCVLIPAYEENKARNENTMYRKRLFIIFTFYEFKAISTSSITANQIVKLTQSAISCD